MKKCLRCFPEKCGCEKAVYDYCIETVRFLKQNAHVMQDAEKRILINDMLYGNIGD